MQGYKNDLKAAMDQVDNEYLQEILKASGQSEAETVNDVKVHDDGTTMEQIHVLFLYIYTDLVLRAY